MTETIAILFIFFVLLLFGIIFYYKYQQSSFEQKQDDLLANRAMATTLKTIFMPELICSRGNAEPEDNCFDVSKLNSINGVVQEHLDDYYFDIFSYATITVNESYPEFKNWTIYDKPKPSYTRKEPTFFVVTLKDDITEQETKYGFGYVSVVVYS
mgnify:FL=1